tara:strand:+ start:179 stop:658 length:480 start_codon:yes stop_codon:yes gene_type:complete
MENNIAATLLILALAFPDTAFAKWSSELGVVEPPREMIVGWNVNEIPSNVTLYYDVDGDKRPDIAFAHPIMATDLGVNCEKESIQDESYWVFSTCPSDHAADYLIYKQWVLYKFIGERWKRIYQHVEQHERDRTCSIRENKQRLGNQNYRRAKKSYSGN